MSRSIWFFEFKGYQSSEAREIQFGYASRDYAKQTADTGLACPFYAARLQKPGDWRQVMFSDGKTSGRSQVSYGEVTLLWPVTRDDPFRHLAFDGRDAKLLFGLLDDDGVLVSGSLRTALEFTQKRPRRRMNTVTWGIVDRQAEFAARSMQPVKFSGIGPAVDVNAAADPNAEPVKVGDAGDLAYRDTVGTSEIDANAVTDTGVSQTGAGIIVSGSGYSEVQSLTISSTGAPVVVNAALSSQIQENGTGATVSMLWYVTRDGNAIIGTSGAPLGAGTSWDAKLVGVAAATAALDTPAAGSRTYKMFARAENTSATTAVVFQRILTIAEYKR